jgi:TolA-binding protein
VAASADDDKPEPTGESTVEEALEYVLVTLLGKEADRYKESLFEEWDMQFDDMKQEVVRISHNKENEILNSNKEEEGEDEQPPSAEAAKGDDDTKKKGSRKPKANKAAAPTVVPIRFICQDGYHTGETFHLLCSAAKPCLAGRSKQARYKKNGLSLYRDLEMSTAHAQIGLDADTLQPYIMDTGYESTSGFPPLLGSNICSH